MMEYINVYIFSAVFNFFQFTCNIYYFNVIWKPLLVMVAFC